MHTLMIQVIVPWLFIQYYITLRHISFAIITWKKRNNFFLPNIQIHGTSTTTLKLRPLRSSYINLQNNKRAGMNKKAGESTIRPHSLSRDAADKEHERFRVSLNSIKDLIFLWEEKTMISDHAREPESNRRLAINKSINAKNTFYGPDWIPENNN